jgi:SAM-dependent methyltransferase
MLTMLQSKVIEASGTRQDDDGLRGGGLLQSPDEWASRNRQLSDTLNELLTRYIRIRTQRALDVGCAQGELTDLYGGALALRWFGIDPDMTGETHSPGGAILSQGFAHKLQFESDSFDAIVFANVYEHLPPQLREATLKELYRVLAPGGILVGQIPNPYFPIESHSRLPFLGCLPRSIQRWYWRLTPTGWDFDKAHFFSVTTKNLTRTAQAVGFEKLVVRNFNYSPEAIPASVRWIAVIHSQIGVMPWAWQFAYRKLAVTRFLVSYRIASRLSKRKTDRDGSNSADYVMLWCC